MEKTIDILFKNEAFAACVKPPGVYSQNDGSEDMIALLSAQLGCKVYPVHRLDAETGGVMVFALEPSSAAAITDIIVRGGFKKEYLAVTDGVPAAESGEYEDLLFRDARRNKSFVVSRERRGVRRAKLFYETLGASGGRALVRVELCTGRTHQIRVQFASRGTPLLGDRKYGSREKGCGTALWSHRLSFEYGGKKYAFESRPDVSAYPWSLFAF